MGKKKKKKNIKSEQIKKHPYFLKKIIAPIQPIQISSLDYQIQELMSSFVFDVDVNCNYIYVDRKSKTYKYNFKKISQKNVNGD